MKKIGYFIQYITNEAFDPYTKIRIAIIDYVLYNPQETNDISISQGSMSTVETPNLENDSFSDYYNASNLCNYLHVLGNNCIVSIVQADKLKIRNISFKFSF